MTEIPFTPTFAALPQSLPIFPLTGALLLPGGQLPLNIFEPRYLNMTFDAMGADRMIGMIQPNPAKDPSGEVAVYITGCAGRITSFNETDDGRLLIILTGVCRFDVKEEIPTVRGYRRIVPSWERFPEDLVGETSADIEPDALIERLDKYFQVTGVKADWDSLRKMASASLVNLLAMNLPFEPEDKQALLEAKTASERAEIIIALSEMSLSGQGGSSETRH